MLAAALPLTLLLAGLSALAALMLLAARIILATRIVLATLILLTSALALTLVIAFLRVVRIGIAGRHMNEPPMIEPRIHHRARTLPPL